ncbi:MAG: lipoyl(octanoyl) transferase LipB [Actinobacteria bacterium]|nr:lipoyl(octanoyl) transferase LipB [Actinomycetota bacterium]
MSNPRIRPAAGRPELWVTHLGMIDYDAATELQARLHAARCDQRIPDVLLLLEHPPVYTRGRRAQPSELPFGEDWYLRRGVALRDADRGGKTTYHGPGQLVGYPIVDTAVVNRDVVLLVKTIEDAIIASLAAEGIEARRDAAGRGVWAGDGKISSLGLHIARGVSTHGLSINVDCDLDPFSWIKPCGLDDPVTSIARVTGRCGTMRCMRRRLAFELAERFGLRQRLVSKARLYEHLSAAGSGLPATPARSPDMVAAGHNTTGVHSSDNLVFSS